MLKQSQQQIQWITKVSFPLIHLSIYQVNDTVNQVNLWQQLFNYFTEWTSKISLRYSTKHTLSSQKCPKQDITVQELNKQNNFLYKHYFHIFLNYHMLLSNSWNKSWSLHCSWLSNRCIRQKKTQNIVSLKENMHIPSDKFAIGQPG